MMRSGNPALKESTFLDLGSGTLVQGKAGAMTLNGTVNKTALLLVVTLAGALFSWSQFSAAMAAGNPAAVMGAGAAARAFGRHPGAGDPRIRADAPFRSAR